MKAWRWDRENATTWQLLDGRGRTRCTVWACPGEFVWHTWNERGTGGENSAAITLNRAKDEAVAAIVRQGWAPGGWKVSW